MNTRIVRRPAALLVATLALACAAPAQAQGWHRGYGGWHGGYYHGWGAGPWWGVGLGLGLGLAAASTWDRDYVVVDRPLYYTYTPPAPVYVYPPAPVAVAAAPAPAPAATTTVAPDPIFYPRNGQTTQQTESDRQACNRWATAYPNAMNDASIFQRATLACMDGRGYTSR